MKEQIKTWKRSRVMHRVVAKKCLSETNATLQQNVTTETFQNLEQKLLTNEKILNVKMNILKDLDEKILSNIEEENELKTLVWTVNIQSWLKRTHLDSVSASTISADEARSFHSATSFVRKTS